MLCARTYLHPPFLDWNNKLNFIVLGINTVPLKDAPTPQFIVSAIGINKMADPLTCKAGVL